LSSITYGKKIIEFTVMYVARKTLEMSVHPDCSITVKAPLNTPLEVIEKQVRKRARWILKQKNYFAQFTPRTPERQFIRGESHLYLGKNYRLKIINESPKGVKLKSGYFFVNCGDDNNRINIEKLLTDWYRLKAYEQFTEILESRWISKFSLIQEKPKIVVKRMKTRWGSLSDNGILTLNIDLIRAPKECIDYVVTHELCHLKHRDHDTKFYKLLESILPEWEKIKHKLELALM